MNKLYIKEIRSCSECGHKYVYKFGQYKCNLSGKKIPDQSTIPDWCKLEDVRYPEEDYHE